MNIVFFAALTLVFIAMALQFAAQSFRKEGIGKAAWIAFLASFALLSAFIVWRGIAAGRLPLSNQFEFATAFGWAVLATLLVLRTRFKADWTMTVALPMAFLILSYAALQPKEITELMPALRSAWFGFHIGSAAIAYSAFVVAGAAGVRYLVLERKKNEADAPKLKQTDFLIYRLIALGFLLLTVTILTGALWAEQAWSSFWSWDPKEVWALITWILYAVYFHIRLRKKADGRVLAWFAVIAVPVVLFTFAGVNTLLPGLHSYG